MGSDPIYSDKLVEITEDSILFRNYYFPFGFRRVAFQDVENVVTEEAALHNGKWRVHGAGDFQTWFPRDWKRSSRDRIFFVSFPHRRRRIGFTVEDPTTVENILSEKGFLG
jgi:hypothetical protein